MFGPKLFPYDRVPKSLNFAIMILNYECNKIHGNSIKKKKLPLN